MASYVTPKKNTAFRFGVSLYQQADGRLIKTTPTLATGDVKVQTDFGTPANLATLPAETQAGSGIVQVDLSTSEMNGDNIVVKFHDAAGAEWSDLTILIQTTTRQIDDLLPTASYTAPSNLTAAQIATGVWQDATSGDFTVSSSIGKSLYTTGAAPGASGGLAIVGSAMTLAASAVQAIWDALTSALTTSGSIGKLLVDNINATISSRASSSEVTAIQNNTRTVIVVPTVIERTDSGTDTYLIHLYLYDEVGNMEAPDSAPTVTLVNAAGTDRSGRLGSTTGTLVNTGHYKWVYTNTSTDALEQLLWEFSVVEGSATRLFGRDTLIVDTTAVDFTSADRTTLNAAATAVALAALSTKVGTPAGATVSDDIAAIKTDTGNLVSRITSTLFSGITSLAQWLGLIAGKQTGNSTARTEMRATGAGSGSYDETTDSLEANRDNIGTAGAGLTAADDAVISAVGTLQTTANAIAVDTGTTIPAAIAAVQADLPQRVTKNTALAGFTFVMYDSTDHFTPKTGLTVTAQRSIDGAAFANCANSASEISAGAYKIDLAAADVNGNTILLKFSATGADTEFLLIITEPT